MFLDLTMAELSSEMFLYGMPFCPLSRKIHFGLLEKQLKPHLVLEKTWQPSARLIALNRTGQLPVLVDREVICANDYVACEYLNEAYGAVCLMGKTLAARTETRRLVSWFDTYFYRDVYKTLFYERALKKYTSRGADRGPSTLTLKEGRVKLREYLESLDQVASEHIYLNRHAFSWADIAGAAHLSCIDYLGDIPWQDFPSVKEWYLKIKSRPTFRIFQAQTFPGLTPCAWYGCLDF